MEEHRTLDPVVGDGAPRGVTGAMPGVGLLELGALLPAERVLFPDFMSNRKGRAPRPL